MCKISFFHCKKVLCKEGQHFVDEPQYCANFLKPFTEKTFFNKKKDIPPWIPTRSLADTNLEPFKFIWVDGFRYINQEYSHPVDCKNIKYVEQNSRESCPFAGDDVIHMGYCEHMMDECKKEEAEKAEKERKARMKFSYFN